MSDAEPASPPASPEPASPEPERELAPPEPEPRRALSHLVSWLQLVGVGLGGLTLGLVVAYGLARWRGAREVLPGVRLAGRELSGLALPELRSRLTDETRHRAAAPLRLRLGERELRIQPEQLGFTLPVEPLERHVLALGRSGHLGADFVHWLARTWSTTEVPFVVKLDGARFDEVVASWEREVLPQRREPSLRWDKELVVDPGQDGLRVERHALGRALRERLERGEVGATLEVPSRPEARLVSPEELEARRVEAERLLGAPIRLRTADGAHRAELGKKQLGAAMSTRVEEGRLLLDLNPEPLLANLKRFRRAIERPARPTSFDVDARGVTGVRAPQTGLRLDPVALLAELRAASARPEREVVVSLQVEEPGGLTEEEASQLGVERLVSQFVTRHPCCEPRVQNIHAVAAKIDGLVLRPGETFSLNRFLGPRSGDEGYVEAPTIVRGKMKATSGGGISQFATTLFNAVFDGGYDIVQRQPHSIWFSRYPEGLEATVSYPSPDLVFRNDTSHGLLIKTRYDGTSIRVLLYGNNEGRRVERHVSSRRAVVEPPLEYLPDPSLRPEESRIVTRGQRGWTVMTRRVVHDARGGRTEQGREVTYQPKPMIVAVHPCRIPPAMKGWTGEKCPEGDVEPEAGEAEAPSPDELEQVEDP